MLVGGGGRGAWTWTSLSLSLSSSNSFASLVEELRARIGDFRRGHDKEDGGISTGREEANYKMPSPKANFDDI